MVEYKDATVTVRLDPESVELIQSWYKAPDHLEELEGCVLEMFNHLRQYYKYDKGTPEQNDFAAELREVFAGLLPDWYE